MCLLVVALVLRPRAQPQIACSGLATLPDGFDVINVLSIPVNAILVIEPSCFLSFQEALDIPSLLLKLVLVLVISLHDQSTVDAGGRGRSYPPCLKMSPPANPWMNHSADSSPQSEAIGGAVSKVTTGGASHHTTTRGDGVGRA